MALGKEDEGHRFGPEGNLGPHGLDHPKKAAPVNTRGGEGELDFESAGRSGKNTCHRLAFVSKMPGRTQHINYFSLGDNRFLVDLPGYGYAKVPEEIRAHWSQLLSIYLATRVPLCGMVLIMDIRRPFTDLDRRMIDWFRPTGRPLHILLSKADKLSRQDQTKVLRAVRAEIASWGSEKEAGRYSAQLFSSLKRTGIEEAEQVLAGWLGIPLPESRSVVTSKPEAAAVKQPVEKQKAPG